MLLLTCVACLAAAAVGIGIDDPFADLVKTLASDSARLREDREAKREAHKAAEKALRESRSHVAELERQLERARAALKRNETAAQSAKAASDAAQKAMMNSLTRIAGDITKTAEAALAGAPLPGASLGGAAAGAGGGGGADAPPSAEGRVVRIFGGKFFSGKSLEIRCCGEFPLADELREAGVLSVRSIQLEPGVHAAFRTSVSGRRGEAASVIDLFGDVGELDSGMLDFRESCCDSVLLAAAPPADEETSVVLYEEEGFGGAWAAYREGDHGAPALRRVGSVRVPAGMRVTLRAVGAAEAESHSFGAILGVLKRDTRTWPQVDTETRERSAHGPPVKSLSVRRIKDSDLHGLKVYFEPNFQGRPQFFESGSQYTYPESWPDVQSMRPTESTFTLVYASAFTMVRKDTPALEANFTRPNMLDVVAVCQPSDFCGPHGKCVQPQRCDCHSGYQGERCHLQNPDGTSAILCDRNVVVEGEAVACRLHVRNDGLPCQATSLFLGLSVRAAFEASAEVFGESGIIKKEGYRHYGTQESSAFHFDVVFNKSGTYPRPMTFSVFGKEVSDTFVPTIEVLRRCDGADIRARAVCGDDATDAVGGAAGGWSCALTLHGKAQEASPLRCPPGAVTLLAATAAGGWQPLQVAEAAEVGSPDVAPSRWHFRLPSGGGRSGAAADVFAEVRHGVGELGARRLKVSVELKGGSDKSAAAPALREAGVLLRAGDIVGAFALLEACAKEAPCGRLRAALLRQMGCDVPAGGPSGGKPSCGGRGAATLAAARSAEREGRLEEAVRIITAAMEASPLDPELEGALAGLALRVGDFEAALARGRNSYRVCALPARRCATLDRAEALRTVGLALFGLGLTDEARQNLRGCSRLLEPEEGEVAAAAAAACEHMATVLGAFRQDMAAVQREAAAGAWPEVERRVAQLMRGHASVLPGFEATAWSDELAAYLCAGRLEVGGNLSTEDLVPCRRAAHAGLGSQSRLAVGLVLRCQLAVALDLEQALELDAAQSLVERMERLVSERSEDEVEEATVSEIRLLRERVARARRRVSLDVGAAQNGSSTGAKQKTPQTYYEVLGVQPNATVAEIKSAYRRHALKYHPDKNKDPEAVQIFLDGQQAYQILSDEELRRKYDAGQNVEDEADLKNMKPMRYRVIKIDRERGIATVWWSDPNTGEEGTMEVEVPPEEEEEERSAYSSQRTLREHCCLP